MGKLILRALSARFLRRNVTLPMRIPFLERRSAFYHSLQKCPLSTRTECKPGCRCHPMGSNGLCWWVAASSGSIETASTRIPRLDGASRIPLPGSLRPPSSTVQAVSGLASRTTQIFQRASTVGLPHKRPSTLAGLRPSIVSANALKRSASGDHITNAMSLVTKKTTTALKKWIGKPEKMLPPPVAPKVHNGMQLNKNKRKPASANKAGSVVTAPDCLGTPRPQLTRSDTFVRTDSPNDNDIINFTPNLLTQSTPAPPTCGALTTTRIIRPPDINETTKLLSNNTRHALYTTQSLDISQFQPAAEFGETFEASMKRTMTLDETKRDTTISLNNQYSPNATEAILKPNLTTTFNAPALLGQTMNVIASSDTFTTKPQSSSLDTVLLENTSSLGGGKIIDHADAISPITNATYSNPDSLDNLQLLEDVSAPSGFLEMDLTLHSESASEHEKMRDNLIDCSGCSELDDMDSTLKPLAPEKTHMRLPLNSTANSERLLDLTTNMLSPSNRQMHMMNLTKDYLDAPATRNTSQLLYMTQNAYAGSERIVPDRAIGMKYQDQTHLLPSPQVGLKGAHSDLVLPTRTPDDEPLSVPMEVDAGVLLGVDAPTEGFYLSRNGKRGQTVGNATSLQDVNDPSGNQKSRYSFGLDLTESTLDCSIDLVDASLSSNAAGQNTGNSSFAAHPHSPSKQIQLQHQHQQLQPLRRQTSFELDESLGILTPDQMKEFLDSTNTNNTNNLELPLAHAQNKMAFHHMRIDQTPSPEELPLDPVEVKTDVTELLLSQQQQQRHQADLFDSTLTLQHQQQLQQRQQQLQQQQLQSSSISTAETISTNTDTDISSKTSDAMTKSNVSKISTSFITSVTSVTSLDTGYQGDGEMSRPASRGACDHSPSNGPTARKGGHVSRQPSFNQQLQQQQMPLVRRQDPMTDSDFFTESDADDIFHRGDRRAQVIDGQLYGPMLQQPAASVFISEDPEDSCMESSGIFTDVENRCDDDLAQMRRQDTQDAMLDMSPEGDGEDSTETVKSNRGSGKHLLNNERQSNKSEINANGDITVTTTARNVAATTTLGQGQLSNSQTSSTIHSSMSTDRLSAATLSNRTSYCSVDGNTVNADCKSFSSLEEAFDESTSALNVNETINHTILSPASAECTRRSRLSTTGNDNSGSANIRSGDECSAGVESKQRSSVQRVTPPRKHASLTSLSTITATNAAFNGAKIGLEYDENKSAALGLTVTRGRALIEGETHSETGTAGTQAAGASTSSSTTSLSLGNHNKTIHHSALEAAVAAAAEKHTATAGTANKSTPRATTTSTKFASARNSPKLKQQQHAYTGSVASVGGDITVNVRKKQTPNKWEAVMNKIQSNKALPKKNLKEVKSKVSTILRPSNGVVGATAAGGGGVAATANGVDSTRARLSGSGGLQGRSSATSTPLIRRSPTSSTMSSRTNCSPTTTAQQVSKRLFQGVAAKR
ncbi:unnamed protein product [Ceratitis capitata]|uniref:(Mediterranean fruit fly) hypothetical protein n=1 Tax=Ceratitis capitata TaxID=7213 RepID=A0A811UHE6_CERCA|nr:unnamed protein product [Ceratitis capitata]